jgi:hypothetical protein
VAVRNLAVRDGVLGEVVEGFNPVAEQGKELEQLQAAVDARQEAFDNATDLLGATPAEAELLMQAAQARDEAKRFLDDSKSELELGQRLVAESPLPDGSVPVGVTVADGETQY